MVPTRSAVHAVHAAAADFASFWLDPWGFMLEAVCHHDRD
jgi:hypothetical protein